MDIECSNYENILNEISIFKNPYKIKVDFLIVEDDKSKIGAILTSHNNHYIIMFDNLVKSMFIKNINDIKEFDLIASNQQSFIEMENCELKTEIVNNKFNSNIFKQRNDKYSFAEHLDLDLLFNEDFNKMEFMLIFYGEEKIKGYKPVILEKMGVVHSKHCTSTLDEILEEFTKNNDRKTTITTERGPR